MVDIRFKDLDEAVAPGEDYWVPTDSQTDGAKKMKPSNLVKPSDLGLSTVATTGDYDDLANRPTLSLARVTPEQFGAPSTPGSSATALEDMVATGAPSDLFPRAYDTQSLDTLDVSNFGLPVPGASFQSVATGDSLLRGRDKRAIGYAMNHREELMYSGAYPRNVAGTAIATGNMTSPPISTAAPVGPVDIVAHWYGVWGLDWTRVSTGIADDSFDAWYDWHWNFTSSADYDPSRHPIFGWYRQQDPEVLDWQCYWLREAGVKAICPVAFDLDVSTWASSGDMNNWLYQLFYNAPNFKQLSYIPWVKSSAYGGAPSSPTPTDIATQWDNIIFTLHDAFPNNYVVHHKGRRWMALYVWDSEFLRTDVFDTGGGSTNFAAFLAARGLNATYRGYDGIALMCHNSTADADMSRASLLANNVLYLDAPYGGAPWSPGATDYSEVVSNFAPPSSGAVLNVSTSLLSKAPISQFNLPGSTPELFRKLLGSALTKVVNSPDLPKCLTVYNVSEWAEGGPGLTPNRDSGFAYLDAIREASAAVSATPLQRRDNYVALTLQNSWVNFGASQEPARVRVGDDGMVHVTGLIKGGTATQTTLITTLPKGYRPQYVQAKAVATAGGTTSVLVNPDGTITLNAAASATLLDISLSFMAAM